MIRTLFAGLPRIALFGLALIPVMIGGMILNAMYQGTTDTMTEPADVIRRASYPVAVTGHIIGGSAMLMLGFAQFSARLRRTFPGWHRWAGRVLLAAGVYFALSGLWMNFSATAQPDSWLYDTAQNGMALIYLCMLALGIAAIRRRDVARHRVWMMRSYAITLGAATQTVMLLPVFLLFGPPEGLLLDLVFISGWAINLAVAEVRLRRGGQRSLSARLPHPMPLRP